MEELELSKLQKYWEAAQDLLVQFGGKVIVAIVLLVIGFWIINRFTRFLNRNMLKREVDESLRPFLIKILNITLKVIVLIPVISILGIATSSFLAILGSAGLAIGLALQGSLANFAGGVIILTLKPFSKGHFIKAQGEMGTVYKINIFNTVLKTPDNQTVYIPNGQLAGSTIMNFSEEETRRLVIDASIGYEDDIGKAKKVISDIIASNNQILKDPQPQVVVLSMSDSAVIISLRAWVKTSEYWNIYFELQEKIKLTFDMEGITIPFPQTTLSLSKEAEVLLKK
jgi:small conductance mechanosensitive channel